MAQAEDTELRDLVIEALEKNGSLAKIRALLRANIFLAFEDECENIKQNKNLDNILNLPEGALCCSIVHEFLEYCNLKNTLFVYKSESRQGRAYKYEGPKVLTDMFNFGNGDCNQEPILMTLVKNLLHMNQLKYQNNKPSGKKYDNSYKDDENCTYIVHEDSSSATCNSQSDNSSDEKNRLHLRLQLDNSDTDTSSDSNRDKSNSEYIPSEHVIMPENTHKTIVNSQKNVPENAFLLNNQQGNLSPYYLNNLQFANSSSDSTSYVELKPFSSFDEKLLNTTGVPIVENVENKSIHSVQTIPPPVEITKKTEDNITPDSIPSCTISATSLKIESPKSSKLNELKSTEESVKSDAEYSYDFSSSSTPKKEPEKPVQENISLNLSKIKNDTQHNSASSQSSVSISDVTDLLSEKSYSHGHLQNDVEASENKKSKTSNSNKKSQRTDEDSGDFSESPVPSLSNLSLDIHSD